LNIYNLKELDDALQIKEEWTSYAQLLNSIRFNFKEIEHLCFWDAEDYSKINVGNGSNYELVLICWENNQGSKIHKHDGQDIFTYVLKGELTEEVFDGNKIEPDPERTTVLAKRDISSLENIENKQHRLTNSYSGRSVSLHLYIK
jgi:cysteine dioxygenase